MRILLVTPYYIPAWGFGGPVKVVSDLARELVKAGHQVTVVTTDAFEATRRISQTKDQIEGYTVLYFRNLNAWAAVRLNAYLPQGFARWLRRHIREFDVIHCHDYYTGLNAIVARIAPVAHVPFVVQPHGALISTRIQARFGWVKRWWLRRNRAVAKQAARIIASTDRERQELITTLDLPRDRVVVIPNGLDERAVKTLRPDERRRNQLGVQPSERVILYFGRIQYIKGVDITIEALARLKDIPWRFVLVGRDDGELTKLQDQARRLGVIDRLMFMGPQFGTDLKSLMSFSDVFVFNSRSESFPIAVLNACAAGLPMVLSPECRLPEVGEWKAGIVLTENTPEQTVNALRQILSDPTLQSTMRQSGQRLVRKKFTLRNVVSMCLELYRSVSL